jgi:hypothetical protein
MVQGVWLPRFSLATLTPRLLESFFVFMKVPDKSDQDDKERDAMVTPESMQEKAMDLFANEMY